MKNFEECLEDSIKLKMSLFLKNRKTLRLTEGTGLVTNSILRAFSQSRMDNILRFVSVVPDCIMALFVFSIDGPKQNAGSLLTLVSDTVFYALSHGTLGFAFHGSFDNQLFQRI